MPSSTDQDKTGSALNAQRFRMLEDIARELAGEVVFPTSFDVAVKLRRMLQDPDYTLEQIGRLISGEPLIAVRLLRMANSALYNQDGTEIRDLQHAIARLGQNVVRSTALAIAMQQLLRSRDLAEFSDLSAMLWRHALKSACAAQVIAARMTRTSPDEAFLAGLVHDLGAFYMLYRAAQYDELRLRPETVKYLIIQWHESIGHTLLLALGLPEDIAEAARDHDQPRDMPLAPRNLGDIVHIANLLAGGTAEWLEADLDKAACVMQGLAPCYLELQQEIETRTEALRATFT